MQTEQQYHQQYNLDIYMAATKVQASRQVVVTAREAHFPTPHPPIIAIRSLVHLHDIHDSKHAIRRVPITVSAQVS
ncbi:hypothetical protein FIBSPDRAFT_875826 [Athelia psychrophila]|uniref:Uncharacterized protein n=1 Tax=Athelia psychrophila TaxID=1759441 RepID=A0A167XFQ6_9AGAM|nr:hypothetical protein FIBSPDRAFT_875826 [Fibularhizoctonia sp. CBS 109695]